MDKFLSVSEVYPIRFNITGHLCTLIFEIFGKIEDSVWKRKVPTAQIMAAGGPPPP